jgi:hypothetical protein
MNAISDSPSLMPNCLIGSRPICGGSIAAGATEPAWARHPQRVVSVRCAGQIHSVAKGKGVNNNCNCNAPEYVPEIVLFRRQSRE